MSPGPCLSRHPSSHLRQSVTVHDVVSREALFKSVAELALCPVPAPNNEPDDEVVHVTCGGLLVRRGLTRPPRSPGRRRGALSGLDSSPSFCSGALESRSDPGGGRAPRPTPPAPLPRHPVSASAVPSVLVARCAFAGCGPHDCLLEPGLVIPSGWLVIPSSAGPPRSLLPDLPSFLFTQARRGAKACTSRRAPRPPPPWPPPAPGPPPAPPWAYQ